MPKSLVICCDGTWDRPVERNAGYKSCTNVYKLWRGLADADRDGSPQRTFYHEGVGTGGRLDRLLGGAFGAGLAHNVCDCYRFLVLNYAPGDRVYLFGFSRGAYTARSVAGMVRNCGILEADNFDLIGQAFQFYRDRGADTSPAGVKAQQFRGAYSQEVAIHFIGVWDTVGSLGVPVMIPIPFWRPWWAFHDSDLSSTVRNAFHAVAIDEQRGPFKPTLWTRNTEPPGQTLEQVWFAGCHRDVGGGVFDPDLADITLAWMVECAGRCGLAFEPDHFVYDEHPSALERYRGIKVHPDLEGDIHESLRGIWKLWRHRRDLPTGGSRAGYPLSRQSASSTAKIRAERRIKGYPPRPLDDYLKQQLPITDVPGEATPSQTVVAGGASGAG